MAHKALSAGNLLREYETLFLVKPDVTDETVEKIKERIKTTVAKDGGKVIKFTHWGKKKTAFPVEKQARALFIHVDYLGGAKVVAEVERNLSIVEDVTKFITTKIADAIDPATREVEEDEKLVGDMDERPRVERESGAETDEHDGNDSEELQA
ncbi:MAG: 30S ribosomal protein S6 [Myxococcales bacterium]|jgi:small subunit ribosomal protein S6|nr:30S ribosomal protein S6 [Myxococcales bacterium]